MIFEHHPAPALKQRGVFPIHIKFALVFSVLFLFTNMVKSPNLCYNHLEQTLLLFCFFKWICGLFYPPMDGFLYFH